MNSRRTRLLFFLVSLLSAGCVLVVGVLAWPGHVQRAAAVNRDQVPLTQYVNPFIGTGPTNNPCSASCDRGDTFPGAAYPQGLVQWSPDTTSNQPGGYVYGDNTIKGFSLTHFSGRGCIAYQDFPFMPYIGTVSASPASSASTYFSTYSHSNEAARPGYYRVTLDKPHTTVELSATLHTGVGQFTFPASRTATLLINTGGSIKGDSDASVSIQPGTNEVWGYATSTVGCGNERYTVHFDARFDRPFSSYGTWNGKTVTHSSTGSRGAQTGAFLTFDTTTNQVVHVQVGISYISAANAGLNLQAENVNFNFNAAVQAADAAWNTRLNSIQVQGGTPSELTVFYTSLYHVFFHPNIFNDVNGQYMGFDGKVHTLAPGQQAQYENIPGWDEYRSLIRLLTLLEPQTAGDIAQSLVNDAQQGDGHLPRWEQTNADSHGMIGDGGTLMIAEAYAFGARNFDTQAALRAMINGQPQVREGYSDEIGQGFVGADHQGQSASMTLEYANADMAISQFAGALGDTADQNLFSHRAANWQNLYNPASGYIQPRNSNGSWASGFNNSSQTGFTEGNAAQYSWLAPYDLADLFAKMGGKQAVVSRLDTFFSQLNAGGDAPYAWMGNEPSEEIPWEYDFAGAPAHTQEVVRRIQLQLFTTTPGGLPGNDDAGALSSWYIFSALGLYPEITGVGGFVIGSPLFTSATLFLGNGNTLQVHAANASDSSPYVQSLSVNGASTSSLWLPWSSVQNGATLDFTLGATASTWGSAPEDAPPSYPPAATSVPFNNEGISDDSNPVVANFDGGGYSYSTQALATAGFKPGATVVVNQIAFSWPTVASGQADNWLSQAQILVPPGTSGSRLAFLGSASNGPSQGTIVISYTDGTIQKVTLAFSDWTLNAGASKPLSGTSIAAKLPYRNGPSGRQSHATYVFFTSVGLLSGKTVRSVILPASVNQGHLHIFAVGIG